MNKLAAAWPRLASWMPAVVLGAFGLFEIWISPVIEPPPFPGPAVVHTAGVLAVVAGLLARVRAPRLALGAVFADVILEWAYDPDAISLTAFAGVLVAFGNIFMKLDLRDRAQAVVFAYESELVRPGPAAR